VTKAFAIGFAAAVLVIVLFVWGGFIQTKGNHLEPSGFISNVRVQSVAPEETLMVIDFSLINDADVAMIASKIDPWIAAASGEQIHGSLFAAGDMKQTFDFYPALGPMLHPPLLLRGSIPGHTHPNLMLGVEFDIPAKVVETRKGVTLHIEDITGPSVDMTAK
jgi:hypothetical protein